ncbi:Phoxy PX domain protein [Pyrenophora tritici-repentis]|uniref:Sorting nexin-4 n=2 Tax=Pyrenophora tritici-repentis TaxID=45151 RepID=A0A2W1EWP6_9PLEO|nr:Phox proteiny domain protein [Pyrenophora tritici-repentis]KAF7446169.1 Phox proteiny domain protein [Pyrenophora tritici-repentis]KAI0572404.1 Phox proteiny (PX) domain protein [Pyrenophora tritici-repentis]KAI0574819.1 Phox proteiny (PX) domain protein [Pyrenophora tritici-repentis]KAI0611790.1 Phox proteiny (PX) domain protein [Pyrenophora tritici-repentis]
MTARLKEAQATSCMYGERGSEESLGANPTCSIDVTDTPPSSPTLQPTASPQYLFGDIHEDSEYDQLSDVCELEESRLLFIRHPGAVRRRAMAADFSEGRLETFVGNPLKELAGTQNQYVSYQVITKSDFQSFQKPEFSVRRRFTDFVFLWKQLSKEYPQCAVPPLPDKHKMEYVRGDRFGPDFTERRAHSLHRFLKRIALHPVLRRAVLFINFLESADWNQHMKGRSSRAASGSEQGGGGFVDSIADTFVNTFTKIHKPDQRFIEVSERANKLSEDLNNVEKVTVKVARRQGDLETDYADLATQCQKLTTMEPAVEGNLTSFAASVNTTSQGFKSIRDHTDQNYLTSLRDMDAYIQAVKTLLRTREAKQLDFEQLSEYLAKSAADRDSLASATGSGMGASGFLRSKVEDFRGIDHDQARRQRVRKLEVEIERLTGEVEMSKKASEAFDEHTVKEVADFERIKAIEFKDTLGDLADAHVEFFQGTIETWEKFLEDMRKEEDQRKAAAAS